MVVFSARIFSAPLTAWQDSLRGIGNAIIEYRHAVHEDITDDAKASLLYLAFVRFRQVYLAETLLEDRGYSIRGLLEALEKRWDGDSERLYEVHRAVHGGTSPEIEDIDMKDISSLIDATGAYLEEVMGRLVA